MINLIIDIVIIGVIAWLVSIAPFIPGTFKALINYVLIFIAVIIVVTFLIGLSASNLLVK